MLVQYTTDSVEGLDDKILKEKMIAKWDGSYPKVVGSDDVLIDINK